MIKEDNNFGLIITILMIIVGLITFVKFDVTKENSMIKLSPSIFTTMDVKVAYTPEGNIKLFSYAKNNELSKLQVSEGENIPESNTIVIGYDEAKMMKEEKLFTKVGDKIEGLFRIDITIAGILSKTDTIIDDMHFISETNFKKLDGTKNKVFIKLNPENMSKVFYTFEKDEEKDSNMNIKFEEGSLANYKIIEENGKTYYPIFIGAKEAKMMKEEKLFTKVGDKIEGLFGKNFVISGVLKTTNTSIDMMHFTTLKFEELN